MGMYGVVMYKCPCLLQSARKYGYTILFSQYTYIYWVYIVINTIILFLAIGLMGKKNTIKTGIYFVIIASFITILELILWISGIAIVQETILGDLLWISTLVYTLNKVSKKKVEETYTKN
jgi:hypothetical protein